MSRVVNPARADREIRGKRARAFKVLFDLKGPNGDEAELVLAALRDFCRANSTTTGASIHETYQLNGRRDVWLFLNGQLNLKQTTIDGLEEAADEFFDR